MTDRETLSSPERGLLVALCRPIATGAASRPAAYRDLEQEFGLAGGVVRRYIARLVDRFGLSDVPAEEQCSRLAAMVLDEGILGPEDF
jgi:hypothetical protein